jgi:hypothetical protein
MIESEKTNVKYYIFIDSLSPDDAVIFLKYLKNLFL